MKQNGTFASDFLASIVVFLVALPLCLGIAIASGVPPAYGLVTGIVGGLIVGSIAGSPLQVSGPAAGLAVFTWQLVQEHGIIMLGPLVLIAGLLQLVAGLLKAGQLFRAISPAVIHGMLAGIGVLIFAAQFHVMVDDSPRGSGIQNLLSIPEAIYKGILPVDGSSHHMAAAIGLCTILVVLVWTKFAPNRLRLIPSSLVAVVVATVAAAVLNLPIKYVDVPEALAASLTLTSWQQFVASFQPKFVFEALALAFVASAETLLSAAAVDQMHGGKRTDYDRELAAQGVGNTLCGVLGVLPMTGVIVRSGANVQAGAKTRLSTVMHGAWIVVLVAAFPTILELVPTASLAALLVYTGYKLVNPHHIRSLAKYGYPVLAIYAITLFTIVATDMLTGIIAGIVLSLAKLVYGITHMGVKIDRNRETGRVDVHLSGAATFIRMPKLSDTLDSIPPEVEAHIHIKDLSYIDHACLDLMSNWERQRKEKGGRVYVEWEELMNMYRKANSFNNNNLPRAA
ncbi:MAG: SulP family inorganic anion transporter [Bryobacteraceae bacterium]|nr:SulP family inorganic anion transporter [Bryobacteraceae bacterium]